MKHFGNCSRGRSQGVPKIFRALTYRAHCAVIFAITQLSHLNLISYLIYIAPACRMTSEAASVLRCDVPQ